MSAGMGVVVAVWCPGASGQNLETHCWRWGRDGRYADDIWLSGIRAGGGYA